MNGSYVTQLKELGGVRSFQPRWEAQWGHIGCIGLDLLLLLSIQFYLSLENLMCVANKKPQQLIHSHLPWTLQKQGTEHKGGKQMLEK